MSAFGVVSGVEPRHACVHHFGLGRRWHDEELLVYLATGHAAGRGSASGPMGEAVDESFSHLAAVANYVTGRFGNAASALNKRDVANFRRQTTQ